MLLDKSEGREAFPRMYQRNLFAYDGQQDLQRQQILMCNEFADIEIGRLKKILEVPKTHYVGNIFHVSNS